MKRISVIFAVLCMSFSTPYAIAGYKMSDYMDRDFDFHKWFGTTTETLRVRAYTPHNPTYLGYLNANWDLHASTGPNGGPLEDGTWTSVPFKHLSSWHMKTYSDGTVREVGDTYPDSGCTIKYDLGKDILWGTGNMNIGQVYQNQLHHVGCWKNWGWVDMRIVSHHSSYTIPAVDHGSWSCPATIFNDVIEIEHTQWFYSEHIPLRRVHDFYQCRLRHMGTESCPQHIE